MTRTIAGGSMADHYAAAAKRRGRKAPAAPQVPIEGATAWRAFRRLHAARQWTELGPSPISYLEIDAYNRTLDEGLDPWEVQAVRDLDDAYRSSQTAAQPATPAP